MRSGDLRHRIQIQTNLGSAFNVQDSEGQIIPSWTLVSEKWGKVSPLSGRELDLSGQMVSNVTHKVTLRYDKDCLPKVFDRIVRVTGTPQNTLTVESVIDDELRHFSVVLLCIEQIGAPVQSMVSRTVTAAYSQLDIDDVIYADTSSGPYSITLQSPGSRIPGRPIRVKQINSNNALTLVSSGGALIDGASSLVYTGVNQAFDLLSDGVAWRIFG